MPALDRRGGCWSDWRSTSCPERASQAGADRWDRSLVTWRKYALFFPSLYPDPMPTLLHANEMHSPNVHSRIAERFSRRGAKLSKGGPSTAKGARSIFGR